MKGGLPVNGILFFAVTVLIIAKYTCTIDVRGANTELLVSNTNLKITKTNFSMILNYHFIVFDNHVAEFILVKLRSF